MKYVALLRGINVGGNSLVKMSELRLCFEKLGFENVVTYINSGNVIFESGVTVKEKLVEKIEGALLTTFRMSLLVVVRDEFEIKKTIDDVPALWRERDDIRCYVAFVKEPLMSEVALKEFRVKEGIDFVEKGSGVVYMTTLLSGLTKSYLNKIAGSNIYKQLTIRNYNTTKKIYVIMKG